MTDRRRSTRAKLLALVLSCIVSLLAVEVGFRLFTKEPWWARIRQEQKPRLGHSVPNVGLRSRDDPSPPAKSPGTYRVMFLGDSFTYGAGVRDAKKVFVHSVQRRLNASLPRGEIERFETFNGGIPGSLTNQWMQLYEKVAPAYDPDMVLAVFFLRDGAGREVASVGLIRGIEEGMNQLVKESFLYRHSYLVRFFRDRHELQQLSDRYLGILRRAYLGEPGQTEEWQRAQANLLSLRDRAKREGRRFAMVIFPVLLQLDESYPLRGIIDVLEKFCRANEIPVLSLLPRYMGMDAPSLWVSQFNQHPNERGHEIAADGILEFVEKLLDSDR